MGIGDREFRCGNRRVMGAGEEERCGQVFGTGGEFQCSDVAETGGRFQCNDVAGTGGRRRRCKPSCRDLKTPTTVPR